MTKEESIKRAQDSHVQYITDHLYSYKDKDKFVFISYKSDDWYVVLHKIVYALVKRGLHVYFDGSFDSHNSLWIEQFPENMESSKCVGVLAFLDDKYVTSYATLLELMYSQSTLASGLPVVPVNLSVLTNIEDDTDTGLGDSTGNTNAEAEEELFADIFDDLKTRGIIKKTKIAYKKQDQGKRKFSKKRCSIVAKELIAHLKVNENHYTEENFDWFIDKLVDTIKDACGEEVFGTVSDKLPVQEMQKTAIREMPSTSEQAYSVASVQPSCPKVTGRIALKEFLKKYNSKTFSKNTFCKIRLVGQGSYSSFSTEYYESAYEMVWAFVNAVVQERGEEYIQFVIQQNLGVKNPPFITAEEHQKRKNRNESVKYRQIDLPGMGGYSMCRHFGQYGWISDVLKRRLQELNLPLDQFWLEYEAKDGAFDSSQQPKIEPESSAEGKLTGPVNLKGDVGAPVEKIEGSMILTEFLKKYNHKTFQASSCKSIRLIGLGEFEKYSTDSYSSARSMVFAFAMKRLDEMGMDYIRLVNESNTGKNPIFITAQEHQERKNRHENVSYKAVVSQAVQGYSMCTHYSEYDWLKNSLKKQLDALGWKPECFKLELEM